MAHFIELTNTDDEKIILNKEWIIKIQSDSDGSTRIFVGLQSLHGNKDSVTSFYQIIYVKENYDSLKSLLICC